MVLGLNSTHHILKDTLNPSSTYYWKVTAYDTESSFTNCQEVFSFKTDSITEINTFKENNFPKVFDLLQNYPNVFRIRVSINKRNARVNSGPKTGNEETVSLVQLSQAGDKDAFGQLVGIYQQRAMRAALAEAGSGSGAGA